MRFNRRLVAHHERPSASIPIWGHNETSEVRRYRDPVSAGRCGREVFT